jgi:indolepyruvate ferredoxin oxidoreductase
MPPSRSLLEKYSARSGRAFMTGVQVLVRLPMDQHLADREAGLRTGTFISGYQGSPLGTYDSELSRRGKMLEEHDIVFQPGLNEELAATSVMGTQIIDTVGKQRFDGVVGIWYGKTPGLDRASDALRHANLIGVPRSGGALALAGDDPTAKSSSLPGASEHSLLALGIPFLYPGDVQEALDFGRHALAMSRSSGLWAGMKIVTNVADGSAGVDLDMSRVSPRLVDLLDDEGQPTLHRPSANLLGPNLQALENSMLYNRFDAARRYIVENELNRITHRSPRDEIGIVAPGKSYFDLREALRSIGLDDDGISQAGIRLLKIGAPYPLDEAIVAEFADGLREIIVVEEKRSFVEGFVKDILYGTDHRPLVVGKRDEHGAPLIRENNELAPDTIARALAPRLPGVDADSLPFMHPRLELLSSLDAPRPLPVARTPYFCSGCPHNTSTQVPDGSVVGAGIGCHGLALLMDPKQVGTVTGTTQMGGEGAQWIGLSHFTEQSHMFQNLGDGTFTHSGSLALRAAVAANVNITYKLLYNSAVAMTGGQAAVGAFDVDRLVRLLLAEGVRKVIVTTEETDRYRGVKLPAGVKVLPRERLIEAEEELAAIEGVTVLVHDQECAAEKRRKRKRGKLEDPARRIFINERVCEGCGDCGEKSNCMSVLPVATEFGRKTKIDQTSCNKDYSCLNGDCPSFLEVVPGKGKISREVDSLDAADLPAPPATEVEEFGIRITGIGGTGVVTIAQVLATAAGGDDWFVRGLDQTGMAQKGGPVVSDLRLSRTEGDRNNRMTTADCDLYLGCDLLTAASHTNLIAADPSRTVSVASSAVVPTGKMVIDTEVEYPEIDTLTERIGSRTRAGGLHVLDAQAITNGLFGSSETANMFLVGVAYQAGGLPIEAAEIEAAIELNGVAVERNVQAFRRGRQAIVDPAALEAAATPPSQRPAAQRSKAAIEKKARAIVESVGASLGSDLEKTVSVRVPELMAYQNVAYAKRYAERVAAVRAAEAERVPGSEVLADAVAHHLYKLMAYKDEAEVARLNIDGDLRAAIEEEFGPGTRYAWKLHPPFLRALGVKRKITLGRWFTPGYHALYATRHLRGSAFNPFGLGRIRRLERGLIEEYLEVVEELIGNLAADNLDLAVEIAELPDMVRGYEEVKLRNVEAYRERLAALRPALAGGRR